MTERAGFRYTVGLIAVIGGLLGLFGLYIEEVPEGNREALLLALGIVLGWGGSVINGEWGSSPAGRRAADIGAEMANKAATDAPKVEIDQPSDKPVPVEHDR